MRKTSYALAFLAILGTLTLNLLSLREPDWLVTREDLLGVQITDRFGLTKMCELRVAHLPGMPSDGGDISWTDFKCRPFPSRKVDQCEKENHYFCMVWTTAGFLSQLAAGFGALACFSIVLGAITYSGRRRTWGVVALLVALHALCLIGTFAIVTDSYVNNILPDFRQARPGAAYVMGTVAWVVAVLTAFGVTVTGMAASRGYRWAAGPEAYHTIQG